MKSMMKKIAAILMAVLMMIQIVPALAVTYSSGMIVGSEEGYKEALEIIASKGTYVLLGQTLELDVNEDYVVEWKSGNEAVATIDENGILTAVAEGTVTITATCDEQTAKIDVTVIDPEPILTEEGTEEENTDEQTEVSSEKKTLVIVINGENERITYDGEEHVLDRYVATANEDFFDESKVVVNGELGIAATDCGFYELNLEDVEFIYDDPDVVAHFVLNNSFLRITPATVVVTANDAVKDEGAEDPELTASVSGLFGDEMIEYTLTRESGEELGEYVIEATGEETQGNYRVEFIAGKFEITAAPTVVIESSIPAGTPVYKGTEINLKAVTAGFGDAELTYQWQWSTDGENWNDIEGATQEEYTYIITRKNAQYIYRVCVDRVE